MNLASFELFSLYTQGKRKVQYVVPLMKYMYKLLLLNSEVAVFIVRFRRISVNEQPQMVTFSRINSQF